MATTLTQVEPPPTTPGGGVVVPRRNGFAALAEMLAAVDGIARTIGIDPYALARMLEPGPVVFAFDHGGRHWHAVEWLAVRLPHGYPVVPADGCTERDTRARAHPPVGVPAGGASPYSVVSPPWLASPQVTRGATQRHRQRARTRCARRHNHGG